eukprot:07932_4
MYKRWRGDSPKSKRKEQKHSSNKQHSHGTCKETRRKKPCHDPQTTYPPKQEMLLHGKGPDLCESYPRHLHLYYMRWNPSRDQQPSQVYLHGHVQRGGDGKDQEGWKTWSQNLACCVANLCGAQQLGARSHPRVYEAQVPGKSLVQRCPRGGRRGAQGTRERRSPRDRSYFSVAWKRRAQACGQSFSANIGSCRKIHHHTCCFNCTRQEHCYLWAFFEHPGSRSPATSTCRIVQCCLQSLRRCSLSTRRPIVVRLVCSCTNTRTRACPYRLQPNRLFQCFWNSSSTRSCSHHRPSRIWIGLLQSASTDCRP